MSPFGETERNMKKGPAAVLLSYVLWGILPIYWKLLADVNSVYVLCCRLVFSLCVSLVVIPATGKWDEAMRVLRDRRLRRYMLACGLFISFNWGAFIYCVASNRVLDASLAYYINPILAILVGFLAFRERLNAAQWTAVALAAAGVVAPMVMEGEFPLLAVLIGLSFAIYGAIKKKADVSGDVSMFIESLLVSPIALAVIVVMEIQGGPVGTGAIAGWRLLLLPLAGIVSYLPLFLYSAGIRTTSMSLSGILMYINPTLQLLCGVLLYDETMSPAMTVAFVCVWLATIVFVAGGEISRRRSERRCTNG